MTTAQQTESALDAALRFMDRQRTIEEIASVLAFEGRDGYLAFVAEWKARYAELSAEIRAHKREMKPAYPGDVSYKGNAQCRRETGRWKARRLLMVRKASKVRAASQWEAARKAAAA